MTYVESFDVDGIFESGQCFRWNRGADGTWIGISGGHALSVQNTDSGVLFSGCDSDCFEAFWVPYFDLETDYSGIQQRFRGLDPRIDDALDSGVGLRILKQNLWETTVSFIISANNNIPRIRGIIERLCARSGELLDTAFGSLYGFPGPEALASLGEDELRVLGLGYRAPYLNKLAQGICNGTWNLEALSNKETSEARKGLQEMPGVGPKVADCVLLFGMHRMEAFPIDTWMRKVLAALDAGKPEGQTVMDCFEASERCRYMGYVQQVLFHAARNRRWMESIEKKVPGLRE